MKIRKQEYDLTEEDLLEFPIWEYALDEESNPGQNEKTIRPYLMPPPLSLETENFLVRAKFVLKYNSVLLGYVKPVKLNDNLLMEPLLPYDLNPVIVIDEIHIPFCYGKFKPDELTISENYKNLGYNKEEVFPIRFNSDMEIQNSASEGVLEGFLYFENNIKNIFRINASDIRSTR